MSKGSIIFRPQTYQNALSLLILTTLLVAVGLACGGESDPTREPRNRSTTPPGVTATPDPTATATPEPPTATPEPTPTPTAVPEEVSQIISMIMDVIELTPEDMSEAEASCMLELAADIDPEALEADGPSPEVVADAMACVPDLLFSKIIELFGIASDELSREEASCLRGWVMEIDPEEILAGEPSPEVIADMMACIPDVFIALLVEEFGLTPEDLSREEASCLRGWIVNLDPRLFTGNNPDPEVLAEVIACIPDVIISLIIAEAGYSLRDLTREEIACLRRWVADIDPAFFSAGAPPQDAVLEMVSCAPHIFQ